jgi:hypothetical protein
MKFAAIRTILFALALVSAVTTGSIPVRNEDVDSIATTDESHTSLQVEPRQEAAIIIGVAQLVVALASFITQLAQGQTATAEPDQNQPMVSRQFLTVDSANPSNQSDGP